MILLVFHGPVAGGAVGPQLPHEEVGAVQGASPVAWVGAHFILILCVCVCVCEFMFVFVFVILFGFCSVFVLLKLKVGNQC